MTPEESRIIRDVFDRLRSMGTSRDSEAQAAVEAELRANPLAGLALVQAVVTLDRERQALEQRVLELQQMTQAPVQSGGGLFGGTPNPWGSRDPQPQGGYGAGGVPNVPPRGGAWARPGADQSYGQSPQGGYQQGGYQQQPQQGYPQPQQQAPQQRGGGLFSTVLGAAGGMAAGYFGAQALGSLFGGGHGGGGLFGGSSDTSGPGEELLPHAGERTAADDNAFFGDNSSSGFADFGGGGDDDSFA